MTTEQDKDLASDRDRYKRETERLEKLIGEEARLIAERDAAIAAKEAAEAGHKGAINAWQMICEDRNEAVIRADQAESREHALGVQVVALQERLALAEACIKADGVVMADVVIAAGEGYEDGYRQIFKGGGYEAVKRATAARAALDAVPGDALANTSKTAPENAHEMDDDGTPAKIVAQSWKLGDDPADGDRCVQKDGWAWQIDGCQWRKIYQFACLSETVQRWCDCAASHD